MGASHLPHTWSPGWVAPGSSTPAPSATHGTAADGRQPACDDDMAVLMHILEWQRLDDAAFLAEQALERALDLYCAVGGPAPAPAEQAVARKLRFLASARLLVVQRNLRRIRAGATMI